MAVLAGGFTQVDFRYRNDDGSETTATWAAAQGADYSPPIDTIFRLRFLISRAVAVSGVTETFILAYSLNGAAYAAVAAQGAITAPVRYANSSNITDNEVTTEQMAGAGTFLAGLCDENGNATITFPAAGSDTEIEFVLQIYSGLVTNGDTLDFRVYRAGGGRALAAYTVTPRSTVAAPEINAVRWYQ